MDGIRKVREKILKIADLRFQYIPIVFNRAYWAGDPPMAVANSPHVHLLRIYERHGMDIDRLWKSDYVRLFEYWNSIGYHKRDADFIVSKINRLTGVYDSIKKNGFDKRCALDVMSEPFWKTRYGCKDDFISGYEIWHGHHRAAACCVLEIQTVPCRIYKDDQPGTKRCERIDRRLAKVSKNE